MGVETIEFLLKHFNRHLVLELNDSLQCLDVDRLVGSEILGGKK